LTALSEPILTVDRLRRTYPLGDERHGRTTFLNTVRGTVKDLFCLPPVDQSPQLWAVRDVSFSVARGEIVGVIGQNGAGKSTLLKVISRVTEPTSGQVRLRGRVAAMLDAYTDFHQELTALENIFLRGAIFGMTRREVRNRFDELVDFSELRKFLDTPVKRYSLGMTTHLSFAIPAHLDSKILLVDEVLSFASTEFREKAMAKMRQDAGVRGRAVLFVSQDMDVIRQLCPRTILMQKGTIIAEGSTEKAIRIHRASQFCSTGFRPSIKA
jgi:lipopolysaccharide transport system ATP-binding protein